MLLTRRYSMTKSRMDIGTYKRLSSFSIPRSLTNSNCSLPNTRSFPTERYKPGTLHIACTAFSIWHNAPDTLPDSAGNNRIQSFWTRTNRTIKRHVVDDPQTLKPLRYSPSWQRLLIQTLFLFLFPNPQRLLLSIQIENPMEIPVLFLFPVFPIYPISLFHHKCDYAVNCFFRERFHALFCALNFCETENEMKWFESISKKWKCSGNVPGTENKSDFETTVSIHFDFCCDLKPFGNDKCSGNVPGTDNMLKICSDTSYGMELEHSRNSLRTDWVRFR